VHEWDHWELAMKLLPESPIRKSLSTLLEGFYMQLFMWALHPHKSTIFPSKLQYLKGPETAKSTESKPQIASVTSFNKQGTK